jgi:hypothetical protein
MRNRVMMERAQIVRGGPFGRRGGLDGRMENKIRLAL